jgi:hypothetical protein
VNREQRESYPNHRMTQLTIYSSLSPSLSPLSMMVTTSPMCLMKECVTKSNTTMIVRIIRVVRMIGVVRMK